MRHWTQIAEAPIPNTDKSLILFQGKDDYHIKISGGIELMSTRKHGSEDALGRLPCEKIVNRESAKVLIGGLGMGFTLAAVLASVGEKAEITVAELIPEVVEWNRGPLGEYSGYPINDACTQIHLGDVAPLLRSKKSSYDIIALDVDNGPDGLTKNNNNWLYTTQGIHAARKALRPRGIIAYWSAGLDRDFNARLKSCGLAVEQTMVYAHGNKGARHTIWFANAKY